MSNKSRVRRVSMTTLRGATTRHHPTEHSGTKILTTIKKGGRGENKSNKDCQAARTHMK